MPKIVAVNPTGKFAALWLFEKAARLKIDEVLIEGYRYARPVIFHTKTTRYDESASINICSGARHLRDISAMMRTL